MFGSRKDKTPCVRCNGSGRESYVEQVPVGGASTRTRPAEKTRNCSVCGGRGFT